jgi:hypothetical protein
MAVAKPDGDMPEVVEVTAAKVGSALPSPEAQKSAEPSTGRWLYADKPLEPGDKDSLGFGAYANALALLMDWKDTSTPLTIAITGPWGSGKTSLAKMAEARLSIGSDWDAPHVICWFDAWASDDAPHLGAAFAAAVAKGVNRQRRWWVRLVMPLPSVMLSPEQRWWRRLLFGAVAVVLAAAAVFWPTGGSLLAPFLHPEESVSGMGHGAAAARLGWPLLIVAVILLARKLAPSVQGVARWIDNPGSEAARGSMGDANRQLGRLIAQALRGKRRLVIFVDNLERCRPPRAIEVCEVVSQLIGHPQVVTVLIGDMDTIALSAEIKYAALESLSPAITGTPRQGGASGITGRRPVGAYGREYLEKLIQIQLRLPPPLLSDLRKMLVPVPDKYSARPPSADESKPKVSPPVAITIGAPKRQRSRVWSTIAATFTAVLVAWPKTPLPSWLVLILAALLASATVGFEVLREADAERRSERTRTRVDEEVAIVVKPTETAVTPAAEQELQLRLDKRLQDEKPGWGSVDSGTGSATIRRRMRQRIISESELRTELDRAVLEVLPLSPRAAKRMLNHAHLLLDIGVERGIFATRPGLNASQLAAWVALTERWPSVAAAITGDPTLLGKLEEIAQQKAPGLFRLEQLTAIENDLGITGLDSGLLDYLRRVDSLVSCVRLLVNFSPDAGRVSTRKSP